MVRSMAPEVAFCLLDRRLCLFVERPEGRGRLLVAMHIAFAKLGHSARILDSFAARWVIPRDLSGDPHDGIAAGLATLQIEVVLRRVALEARSLRGALECQVLLKELVLRLAHPKAGAHLPHRLALKSRHPFVGFLVASISGFANP